MLERELYGAEELTELHASAAGEAKLLESEAGDDGGEEDSSELTFTVSVSKRGACEGMSLGIDVTYSCVASNDRSCVFIARVLDYGLVDLWNEGSEEPHRVHAGDSISQVNDVQNDAVAMVEEMKRADDITFLVVRKQPPSSDLNEAIPSAVLAALNQGGDAAPLAPDVAACPAFSDVDLNAEFAAREATEAAEPPPMPSFMPFGSRSKAAASKTAAYAGVATVKPKPAAGQSPPLPPPPPPPPPPPQLQNAPPPPKAASPDAPGRPVMPPVSASASSREARILGELGNLSDQVLVGVLISILEKRPQVQDEVVRGSYPRAQTQGPATSPPQAVAHAKGISTSAEPPLRRPTEPPMPSLLGVQRPLAVSPPHEEAPSRLNGSAVSSAYRWQ
mmetsp:Transcript_59027/g.140969  ORF Transcript_59027/g.140969 Transcript_59027/m.140969 type:complete len:391 (-) Transcript_59027:32-1204(-)